MHSEKQAKELWCPHAVASHTNPRQRLGNPENWLHHCIASRCAAWRWEPDRDPALETIEGRGWCGLSGRPE